MPMIVSGSTASPVSSRTSRTTVTMQEDAAGLVDHYG